MKSIPVSTAVDYRLPRSFTSLRGMECLGSVLSHGVCPNAARIITSYTTEYSRLSLETLNVSSLIAKKLGEPAKPMVSYKTLTPQKVRGIWLQPEYQDLSQRAWVHKPTKFQVASLHGYTVIDIVVSSLEYHQRLLWLNALNAAAPVIMDWVSVDLMGWVKYRRGKSWYRSWPWLDSLEREVAPWGWQWQKNYGAYERQVLLWDSFSNPKHKLARFVRRDPFASVVCHPAQLHDWDSQSTLRFWPLPALPSDGLPLVVGEVVNWLRECLKSGHQSTDSLPLFKGRAVPKSPSEWLYLWQKY